MRFIFRSPLVHDRYWYRYPWRLLPCKPTFRTQVALPSQYNSLHRRSYLVVTVDGGNPSGLWHLGFRHDHL